MLFARALAIGVCLAALASADALAQRTRYEALLGCERFAVLKFKRHDPAFRRFIIDRASVEVDKFADKVGNQFVSTVYSGKALYEAGNGPKTVRFVCLHAGSGRGPVFVYALGD